MTTVSHPPRDQASRLRAMVSNVYGPGVAMATFAEPTDAAHIRTAAGAPPVTPRERSVPVVAITSGKGGVGKTSLAVNLAIALQGLGCRTSLLDADLGLANADVMCGINPTTRLDSAVDRAGPGRSARSLGQIAMIAPGGFRLVPGAVGIARMANLPAAQRAVILDGLTDLEAHSDIILVDTGAGLSDGVTSFVAAADLAVVVATPEPTSIADAYAMIKCAARAIDPPDFALVVNQCENEDEGMAVHARIASTCKKFLHFSLPLLGSVRRDGAVPASVRSRTPLLLGTPRAKAGQDIREVAAMLTRKLPLRLRPEPLSHRRGLFGWFRAR